MRTRKVLGVILLAGVGLTRTAPASAQQVVDSTYRPQLSSPAYAAGKGPVVRFDANHNNPTLSSTLLPLRRVLEADGYVVEQLSAGLTASAVRGADIVVVIDALADRNVDDWTLPTLSAFDADSRAALLDWVQSGGALLLVGDHMPFAGAASALASDLGLEVLNGFAIDTVSWNPITFRRSDTTLRAHAIVEGRGASEQVDSVFTYWGHAFRVVSASAHDLLVLGDGIVSMQPREAWRFDRDTQVLPVDGWTSGVSLTTGKGRVVVLGDSGMLTAHLVGPARQPVGFNAPEAAQNEQFVLNIFHWLDGLIN